MQKAQVTTTTRKPYESTFLPRRGDHVGDDTEPSINLSREYLRELGPFKNWDSAPILEEVDISIRFTLFYVFESPRFSCGQQWVRLILDLLLSLWGSHSQHCVWVGMQYAKSCLLIPGMAHLRMFNSIASKTAQVKANKLISASFYCQVKQNVLSSPFYLP